MPVFQESETAKINPEPFNTANLIASQLCSFGTLRPAIIISFRVSMYEYRITGACVEQSAERICIAMRLVQLQQCSKRERELWNGDYRDGLQQTGAVA